MKQENQYLEMSALELVAARNQFKEMLDAGDEVFPTEMAELNLNLIADAMKQLNEK